MITTIDIFRIINNYVDSQRMYEKGLIKTHEINSSLAAIEEWTSGTGISMLRREIINNKIYIRFGNFEFTDYLLFLPLINNLGYFVSQIETSILNNETSILKYDKWPFDQFQNKYDNEEEFNKIQYIEFILEPIFDKQIINIDNLYYHVTYKFLVDKIMKNGLSTKTRNVITYHPERLYLTTSINDAKLFAKNKTTKLRQTSNKKYKNDPIYIDKQKTFKKSELTYSLLEINVQNINNFKLYKDPNFENGYYTLDTISPENIKIIDIDFYKPIEDNV